MWNPDDDQFYDELWTSASMPTIGRDLHFSATSLQWVITAYSLTFGGLLLLGGRAADLLGRRRVLMFGFGPPNTVGGATRTVAVLAAAVALLAGFLMIESRAEAPVLPLSIFRLRTLAGANIAGLLLGGSFYAFRFVGTLSMQDVLHYSAIQSGAAWLAASLTSIVLAGLSQLTAGG